VLFRLPPGRLKTVRVVSPGVSDPPSREEKLELGVELLAHLEHEELALRTRSTGSRR